jgi:peptidoglycan/LPS O-acetylase OafA/YrhL
VQFVFVKQLLATPIARFFGDISYGVYLIHALVLPPLLFLLLQIDIYHRFPPVLRFAILVGAGAALTIPCSYLAHRSVELPGIELGRRLARKVPLQLSMIRSPLSEKAAHYHCGQIEILLEQIGYL